MKRKVNKVGTNTLTVSLPSSWVKKVGVKPGDELQVIEEGSGLLFLKEHSPKELFLDVDVTGLDSMLNRTICAIYKAGYTSVNFRYSTNEELEVIHSTLDRTCHVFEVMQVKDHLVEVRTISSLDSKDFDKVLRKMGFALLDMADESLVGAKEKDEAKLNTVVVKDKIVDRHSDFCRRIMNGGFQPDVKRPYPLYVIIEQTEILADIYKRLSKDLLSGMEMSKDLLDLLKHINRMVRHFYESFYKFDVNKMVELGKMEVAIRKKIEKICSVNRSDAKLVTHLANIFETSFEMKGVLMTLHV